MPAGTVTVFEQNRAFGPTAHEGDEVWLSWLIEHGFGLADEPESEARFASDTATAAIAVERRNGVEAELGEH
jgi:spermidine/putrescine transport system ATP-binding protein